MFIASHLRLLRHESEVAEEENAQAEAQEKKDEAEVQVNHLVHPRSLREQK
ncbi:ribosomal protein L41, isoform CRA_a [Rattus norvegicus]|uniref:Ribosomal protein L41, isoform CRA_a n=1 Tax=Rattus norvegicus TaxID=10116 RepID=A6KSF3_RAT|nr:ribosomal protein L41, isoform CRA_a [Rattus norvegicus]